MPVIFLKGCIQCVFIAIKVSNELIDFIIKSDETNCHPVGTLLGFKQGSGGAIHSDCVELNKGRGSGAGPAQQCFPELRHSLQGSPVGMEGETDKTWLSFSHLQVGKRRKASH